MITRVALLSLGIAIQPVQKSDPPPAMRDQVRHRRVRSGLIIWPKRWNPRTLAGIHQQRRARSAAVFDQIIGGQAGKQIAIGAWRQQWKIGKR